MQNQNPVKQLDALAGQSTNEQAPLPASVEMPFECRPPFIKQRTCGGRKIARRGITIDSGIFQPFRIN